MTRLIDANALKEYIDCGHLRNPCEVCFSERDVVDLIDAQPTIDAVPLDGSFLKMSKGDYLIYKRHWLYEHFDQEIDIQRSVMKSMGYEYVGKNTDTVRHGKWVVEDGHVCCSECGEISKEYNYCPYCGARMDKDDR